MERRKVVEGLEERTYNVMLKTINEKSVKQIEENVKSQVC